MYIRVGSPRSVVVQDPVQYWRVGSGTVLSGMLDERCYVYINFVSDVQLVNLGNSGNFGRLTDGSILCLHSHLFHALCQSVGGCEYSVNIQCS